ncbi:PREDICTED: uncharacterized protein LOC104606621 isoform X2 [Nelumbo nucifera]|uniref:Uncharacterized protein LOC104606621 isoform X2 n=1 Tax=Nelumbo nucifera TaxID=4432 RepID=A0A1U8AQT2_NELNU|nr:PREDICTED: uncharacterized protein LOC104606621 isoform X2 [Nelumbo nucifera]
MISLSFREPPMFLQLENEDFFFLSFQKISEKAKFAKKKKKSESATTPRKIETQCDSENTGPVSILDLSDALVDSGTPLSDKKNESQEVQIQEEASRQSLQSPTVYLHLWLVLRAQMIGDQVHLKRKLRKQGRMMIRGTRSGGE